MFRTEVDFCLPLGLVEEDGSLQREGTMRRATGADEIQPLRDPRVQGNPAYLIIILLSRVITRLGSVAHVTPKTIESLYATDLAYLQDLYNTLNGPPDGQPVVCPQCQHQFTAEPALVGGS